MKSIFTFFLLSYFTVAYSQPKIDTRPLLYKYFLSGEVLMKSGKTETAEMNYNTNNQQIVFVFNDQIMELTGLDQVLKVKIDKSTFIPIEGKFYELSTDPLLIVSYSNRMSSRQKTVGKIGVENAETGEVSNNVSNTALIKRNEINKEIVFEKNLFLLENSKALPISSTKDFAKTLGVDKKKVANYIKANNINLRSMTDIINALNYFKEVENPK